MPAGHGVRARTRDLFARPFRRHGYASLGTYLRTYKIGQYVDIKVNGSIHKGMPHKFYHGRTGVVWNITKRAIGVVMNKQVGDTSPLLLFILSLHFGFFMWLSAINARTLLIYLKEWGQILRIDLPDLFHLQHA